MGRCVFCSLCCPILPEHWWSAHYWMHPEPEAAEKPQSFCGRGSSLLALVDSTERTRDAIAREAGQETQLTGNDVDRAFQAMVEEAARSGRIAVMVDGNLPCEDLAAVHRWALARGDAVAAVYLPPSDFDLLDGMSAVSLPQPAPETLPQFDAVLVVGDALTTHPALARPLLDAKYGRPARPLIMIDTHASRTMRFADFALTVEPDRQEQLLAALRAALCEPGAAALQTVAALGRVDESAAERMQKRLAAAGRLAVVLAAEPTKAEDWRRVAAEAAQLAKVKSGALLPLYSYGNAVGAYRIHRNLGMPRFETLLADNRDDWSLLVLVGWDPTLSFCPQLLQPLYRRGPRVVMFSAVETPGWRAADLAVAMALPIEHRGHVLSGHGELLETAPMHAPMHGAVRVVDFFSAAAPHDAWVNLESVWQARPAPAPPMAAGSKPEVFALGRMRLLTVSACHRFADDALTGRAAWNQYVPGEAELLLHPLTADALNLAEGARVTARRNGHEFTLRCSLDASLPVDVAVAPLYRPDVRRCLPWRLDAAGERLVCESPAVELFPAAAKGAA